jgi:DNA (cytosine-5)-methyltransferase 1
MRRTFYEFFAGGGMARAGLGPGWSCLFANDVDPKKARVYAANWGAAELVVGDVHDLATFVLPGRADLAWASFPCQDVSLAGPQAGLHGARSSAFWGLQVLLAGLGRERRAPRCVVLENVCGLLTSNGGRDFATVCKALTDLDYSVGAMVIDAALFVPQSRPRLFILAVAGEAALAGATTERPDPMWHPRSLADADLPAQVRARWVWWRLPEPPPTNLRFSDLVEDEPGSVPWHAPAETARLLELMSPANRAKVEAAKRAGRRMVGGVYRRTRPDGRGGKVQRAEVRFDDVAGCLRTPAGGSSRQSILVVEGERVRSRLLSAREAARLMGLPDDYALPAAYNDAYHVVGDGVAAPVVRFLAENLIEPLTAAPDLATAA